jgi:hypothetical protein
MMKLHYWDVGIILKNHPFWYGLYAIIHVQFVVQLLDESHDSIMGMVQKAFKIPEPVT